MPVFAMASRTMSPTAPPKAAQIIGLEGEADAGEAQQRHQRRRRHRGRGQQLEAAGAELRKHLRIAAELAGKRVMLSRPEDRAPISLAASVRRMLKAWVSGLLRQV